MTHEQKVIKIAEQLGKRKSSQPLSIKKKSVSHEVPKPNDGRYNDEKIDMSELTSILQIDVQAKTCTAEAGVTFKELVKATLKHGLVPYTVPELKTITLGGAVAGCSIESMSFKYGGFHDSCLEYEVFTAQGEIIVCTPQNNSLLFEMVHGTFGTVAVITRLKFKLLEAQPYVKLTHEKYHTLEDYKKAIWMHFEKQDIDFMDGFIHSPQEYVLCAGNFVPEAPYTHNYDWMRIYFLSTRQREEDYLKTIDYFFRYDKGITTSRYTSFFGKLLLRKLVNSTLMLNTANQFHKFITDSMIPVTVDVFVPFSRVQHFLPWYAKELQKFPLWVVPYRLGRGYAWLSDSFMQATQDKLFLDLAVYGLAKNPQKNYYRLLEEELLRIGGLKTLISTNYYSEKEFWQIWNKKNYTTVKAQTDPHNILRDLYTKTCKVTRGIAG
jgi:FAD/FMN-containing dehydrogenase